MWAMPMMMKAASIIGTNLIFYSEEVNNAYWTKSKCSISANNATAPDSAFTADRVTEDTTYGVHGYWGGGYSFVSGNVYTFSCFLKMNSQQYVQLLAGAPLGSPYANFDLQTGTAGTRGGSATNHGIVDVGGGWYRCFITFTAGATGIYYESVYFGASTSDTFIPQYVGTSKYLWAWGMQLEAGAMMNGYQPKGAP